jgi:hypothetical protein
MEHFGDQIIISSVNDKPNIGTFRETAFLFINFTACPNRQILKSKSAESFKQKTAAKLMKSDIKSIDLEKSIYHDSEELASLDKHLEFIPESLKYFLSVLITVKVASIGQANCETNVNTITFIIRGSDA